MASLKDKATEYKSPETKNISELQRVPVDITIQENTYAKDDGTPFSVNEIEVDGEKYRVPNIVLKQMQGLLKDIPDLKAVRVMRSGEGLKTTYNTIPLQE